MRKNRPSKKKRSRLRVLARTATTERCRKCRRKLDGGFTWTTMRVPVCTRCSG